jgi:hypothetical protein
MTFEPSPKWRNDAKVVNSLDGGFVKKSAVTCERRAAEDKNGNDPKSTF